MCLECRMPCRCTADLVLPSRKVRWSAPSSCTLHGKALPLSTNWSMATDCVSAWLSVTLDSWEHSEVWFCVCLCVSRQGHYGPSEDAAVLGGRQSSNGGWFLCYWHRYNQFGGPRWEEMKTTCARLKNEKTFHLFDLISYPDKTVSC